jgi:hypothetical protein
MVEGQCGRLRKGCVGLNGCRNNQCQDLGVIVKKLSIDQVNYKAPEKSHATEC